MKHLHHTSLRRVYRLAGGLFGCLVLALVLLLAGALVPGSPYELRIVESGSMAPSIPLGSVIIVSPQEQYQVGDVVTFKRERDGAVITHRIMSEQITAGQTEFIMRGDANTVDDPYPVVPSEIIGRVWGHIPGVGFLLDWARQPLGFILLVAIPAVLLIFEQVGRIRRQITHPNSSSPTS